MTCAATTRAPRRRNGSPGRSSCWRGSAGGAPGLPNAIVRAVSADSGQRVSTEAPLAAVAVLLALLCAALYVNVRAADFTGDDYSAIVENPAVRWRELSLANLKSALAHPRPVVSISYGLNYRLGRLDPRGYHALNAALHVANALLVYALGCALFRRARAEQRGAVSGEAAPWAALVGAALFAAHPLQVEAVTWAAQRGSLLAALFSLGAVLCHLRGRAAEPRSVRAGWWGAAGACWLLAVGSRESALGLPLVLCLCEWFVRDGLTRRVPLALGLCVAAAVVWLGLGRALALHESLAVWPLPARLSLAHDLGGSPFALAAATALQALLLGAAIAGARRYRIASFALLWFLCVHAAEAAFAADPLAAEHRNYLALAGPALAVGWALFASVARGLGVATALSLLAVTALGAATHARNELWLDPAALWDDAVAESPRDAAARLERGALFAQAGRPDEALADFDEAVRLAPDSARARARLAASLADAGRAREALPHAREAVALDAASAAAHAALGRIEAELGRLEAAAAAFTRALALGETGLERRLGDTLVRLRRFEEALPHYRAAIARDPGDDDARTGAGAALVELGRARDALAYLEPAVESQPNPHYLVHFADALWQLGDARGAIDAVSIAVRVAPDWRGATSRLAWMLALTTDADRRDPARALRIADTALARAPDALLLDARAAALAAVGRFAEARADADRAAGLASSAGDSALADAIAAHADSYARHEPWPEPPRPFDPSP